MNAERLAKSTANFAKLSARSADYKLKMQSDSDEENVDQSNNQEGTSKRDILLLRCRDAIENLH